MAAGGGGVQCGSVAWHGLAAVAPGAGGGDLAGRPAGDGAKAGVGFGGDLGGLS